jgi:hypothetical protein
LRISGAGSVFASSFAKVLPGGICAAQARNLALLARFGLHLQYFQNQQQRVAMASVLQAHT